jgi:glycosyltransferase involved in cell wall biosynthesis
MIDFTVAIRTYNGEKLLPALLDRLRSQVGTEKFSWEIVIVDNNSSDETASVIQQYQASWPIAFPLKYFFEAEQGAATARQRAIREAQGVFITFLDDDNYPSENWVAECYAFAIAHPKMGACGSQIHGEYEVEPPANFSKIAPFLPVIEREKTVCFNSPEYARAGVLPPGAGLMIRKQAWVENVPKRLVLQGPIGSSLAAKGEDIEALLYIRQAGWEIWYNPSMQIYHCIPKQRFEKEYLIRFFRGIGLNRYYTRMLGFKPWQRPGALLIYMANDIRKIILHLLRYRQQIREDLVAACFMELFLSSFISPFYVWKQKYLQSRKYKIVSS